jgi:hypothetical protein
MARWATTVNLTVHERKGGVVEQRDVEIFQALAGELRLAGPPDDCRGGRPQRGWP